MKSDSGKVLFFILFLTLSAMTVVAGTIKGTVTDKQTREPLTGATIQIAGTTQGTVADVDGNYSLDVNNGIYTLAIKYVGYKDIIINNVKAGKSDLILNFELESDAQALGEVSVVARKNLEGRTRVADGTPESNPRHREPRFEGDEPQRHQQCGRRSKKDYGHLRYRCRPTHCARTGRPLQHHNPERTPHSLAQPRQQTDSAGPFPVEYRTEHHSEQGI